MEMVLIVEFIFVFRLGGVTDGRREAPRGRDDATRGGFKGFRERQEVRVRRVEEVSPEMPDEDDGTPKV